MAQRAADRLKFRPNDGQAVVATGRVDIFEPQGKYQFYIDKLEPSGTGALELAFRQLAEKLRAEGLFNPEHKKSVPCFPRTIAIITSPTGAAIEDIGNTLQRRWPIARKLLYPVAVQGPAAAPEIAHALNALNQHASRFGGIDVIILSRGGGSIEDLWAFNEEIVARAVYASEIPIIAGVGHEVDVTIAELVADQRAATPTAAAELAVPVLAEVRQAVLQTQQRISLALTRRLDSERQKIQTIAARPIFARPLDLVNYPQQRIDHLESQLKRHLSERLHAESRKLQGHTNVIRRIEPHNALNAACTRLTEHRHQLDNAVKQAIRQNRELTKELALNLKAAQPTRAITQHREKINNLQERIVRSQHNYNWRITQTLTAIQQRLQNLDPRSVLKRGYSITRNEDGTIIREPAQLQPGQKITSELTGGYIVQSQITNKPNQRKDNS